ncbi:MAG TPA: hypothetical protein VEP47_18935 [Reyranella sp.]|jgi:hypothetical protein|nr:hypothetical protein [Reyranella sp.]
MSIEPPLKGIHVVELSHTILRPSCGMILADLALQRFSSRGDVPAGGSCYRSAFSIFSASQVLIKD